MLNRTFIASRGIVGRHVRYSRHEVSGPAVELVDRRGVHGGGGVVGRDGGRVALPEGASERYVGLELISRAERLGGRGRVASRKVELNLVHGEQADAADKVQRQRLGGRETVAPRQAAVVYQLRMERTASTFFQAVKNRSQN